ncbi:MAG TPA: ABC transporter ATP-binding protein [Caldilineaceae bacterium]|nr:ABC transporter ATP-binding protein [Caldilineaceae bacterium]
MTNLTNGAAPLLEVQQVRKVFSGAGGMMSTQEVLALDDVSLVLQGDQAKLLTIVGESGSGKSTLARCILGLTPISGGSIRYRGQEISQMNKAELLAYRRAVQPVFQDPYSTYNPFYRIDRVLNMIVRKFKLAPSPKEASKLIDEALRAVDLRPHDVLGRYPHQLSGGERQRIMLARIYLMKPRLIIADEPISMIDAALRALFLNILLDFRDQLGISCIFITHNLSTAYYLGGEIMVMCRGRAIEEGNMDAVIKEPSHPYTQLLIDSVPSQDPRNRWSGKRTTNAVEASELHVSTNSCVFAERCPQVMEICRTKRPPAFTVDGPHTADCFLYEENGVATTYAAAVAAD